MQSFLDRLLSDPVLGLITNVCLMLIAIWSVSEAVFANKTGIRTTYTVVTPRGWRFLFAALFVILLSFLKDCNHERQINNNTKSAHEKDSTNKIAIINAVNSANLSNTRNVIKALAEYGLRAEKKYDSALRIVKDSARNVTNSIAPQHEPSFELTIISPNTKPDAIQIRNIDATSDSLYVFFTSYGNNSDVIFLSSVVIIPIADTVIYNFSAIQDKKIPEGASWRQKYKISNFRSLTDTIFIRFFGKYYKADGKHLNYINSLVMYAYSSGEYSYLSGPLTDVIDDYLVKKSPYMKKLWKDSHPKK